MEKRNLNMSFNKSGSGNITPRLTLPALWIKEMGINLEDRAIEATFENGKITIEKLESKE